MSLPNGRPVLSTRRWRDNLPGVLAFLAQPIGKAAGRVVHGERLR